MPSGSPPVRVGIDGSNLRLGGGITHLVELLNVADPAAHGISRVVVWAGSQLADQLPSRPWLDVVREPHLDGHVIARTLWKLTRLDTLARDACDVLFAPGGAFGGRFTPVVSMSRNLLPFESTERGRYGMMSSRGLKLGALGRVQARTMRRAAGVIFLNEYARRVVLRSTGPLSGETRIIPHGVDTRFLLTPREQRPLADYSDSRPFRLLYVSTIDLYKHQWHVAEAVARLREAKMPLTVDFVGSAYAPALERLRETLGRLDPGGTTMRYVGPASYSELPSRYHAADAFVFASSCENMPNILLEAMAAGLPIACAKRGPMPDLLGDAGEYFDPENPDSIAQAVRRLVDSPARRQQLAGEAFLQAGRFSWHTCASATFELLQDVARRR